MGFFLYTIVYSIKWSIHRKLLLIYQKWDIKIHPSYTFREIPRKMNKPLHIAVAFLLLLFPKFVICQQAIKKLRKISFEIAGQKLGREGFQPNPSNRQPHFQNRFSDQKAGKPSYSKRNGNPSTFSLTTRPLGSSVNIYTVASGSGKPILDVNPSLNSLVFIRRGGPTDPGGPTNAPGNKLFYDISTNGGLNWTLSRGPLYTDVDSAGRNGSNWGARYPMGVIVNKNNNINSAGLVWSSAVLTGSNGGPTSWGGYSFGSHPLNNVPPTPQRFFQNTTPPNYRFIPDGMTSTINNQVFTVEVENIVSGTGVNSTGRIIINRGLYNDTVKRLISETTSYLQVIDTTRFADLKICFSPDGNIGYVSALAYIPGNSSFNDKVFYPVIWKTTNAGNSWTGPTVVNINDNPQLAGLREFMFANYALDDTTIRKVIYSTGFEHDAVVDQNGNLHLLVNLLFSGLRGSTTLDLNFTVRSGVSNHVVSLVSVGGNVNEWSYYTVGNPHSFRGQVFSTVTEPIIDNSPQVSRSQNGRYIIYSYASTDTTINTPSGTNNYRPDLWVKALDVADPGGFKFSSLSNVTRSTSLANNSWFCNVPERCFLGDTLLKLPVSHSVPADFSDDTSPTNHFYVDGINFNIFNSFIEFQNSRFGSDPLVFRLDSSSGAPQAPNVTSSNNPNNNFTFCGSSGTLFASGSGTFSWFRNSVLIPGQTSNSITVTQSGTYTVTVTVLGQTSPTSAGVVVSFVAAPNAAISYSGTGLPGNYCNSNTNVVAVTLAPGSSTGGVFTATPFGLSVDSTSGSIRPNLSTPGVYTVTYRIAASGSCPQFSTNTQVTITNQPGATIGYAGSGIPNAYCRTVSGSQAVQFSGTSGGTFSVSPTGLTINSVTGSVTPSSSTPGLYTVTYTIPAGGGCGIFQTQVSLRVTAPGSASISYPGSNGSAGSYCSNIDLTQSVSLSGLTGGVFSSVPAGLFLNANGSIVPSSSLPGTYFVTYSIAADSAGGCPPFQTSTQVRINTAPNTVIIYEGSNGISENYCTNISTAQQIFRTGTTGGTFSATPAGLSLSPNTGTIFPSASTAGSYLVTLSIPPSNGCPAYSTTANCTINRANQASIRYTANSFCTSQTDSQFVQFSGTTLGQFSSNPSGLSIHPTTGAFLPSTSTPGSYIVKYFLDVNGSCPSFEATFPVTIVSGGGQTASISYPLNQVCLPLTSILAPTIVGVTNGTFSIQPFLSNFNAANGQIFPGTAIPPGSYQVVYSLPATGGCGGFQTTFTLAFNQQPSATITYQGQGGLSQYCNTLSVPQLPIISGTQVGTFSATPGGLIINSSTGSITPFGSSVGSYQVSYSIPAVGTCSSFSTTSIVRISSPVTAAFSYQGSGVSNTYCNSISIPQSVTFSGSTNGFFQVNPSGLSINRNSGSIVPSTSLPGTYTVEYVIPIDSTGGCPSFQTSQQVVISSQPNGTIIYEGSNGISGNYCNTLSNTQPVFRTGSPGGSFSVFPSGLSINPVTGSIIPSSSQPGIYVVTLTMNSMGCQMFRSSTEVRINQQPFAAITYSGNTFCTAVNSPQLASISGTLNGRFRVTPSGLSIDSITGSFLPSLSSPGTYTIRYYIGANGACSSFQTGGVLVNIIEGGQPTSIAYPQNRICLPQSGNFSPTIIGNQNGVFRIVPFLANFNPNTGSFVTATNTTPGRYTIYYSVPAIGGCGAFEDTAVVEIVEVPRARLTNLANQFPCLGDTINIQVANRPLASSIIWFKDGIETQSQGGENYSITSSGRYHAVFERNQCRSLTFDTVSIQFSNSRRPRRPDIEIVNPPTACIPSFTLQSSASGTYDNRQWLLEGIPLLGANGQDLTSNKLGNYQLELDSLGCKTISNEKRVQISGPLSITPEIKAATVRYFPGDTTRCEITWERSNPVNPNIRHVVILRQNRINNQYDSIGVVGNGLSDTSFVDRNSLPWATPYFYRIQARTLCPSGGNYLTPPSPTHRTIHLQISKSPYGSIYHLNWSSYLGFIVSSYRIYRGLNANPTTEIAQIAGNITSFTDSPNDNLVYYYKVEAETEENYLTWGRIDARERTASSNTRNSLESISDTLPYSSQPVTIVKSKIESKVHLFPNPFTRKLRIETNNQSSELMKIEIRDITGKVLNYFERITEKDTSLDLEDYPSGIYFITIKIASNRSNFRVVKIK